MELTGKIIAALGERSGISARTGVEWRVASYLMETLGDYPHKMCFDVFGADRIQSCNIQLGETLKVRFDIDAHEYGGRWYNTIRAFGVDRTLQSPAPPSPASAVPGGVPFSGAPAPPASDEDSELPF